MKTVPIKNNKISVWSQYFENMAHKSQKGEGLTTNLDGHTMTYSPHKGKNPEVGAIVSPETRPWIPGQKKKKYSIKPPAIKKVKRLGVNLHAGNISTKTVESSVKAKKRRARERETSLTEEEEGEVKAAD